MATKGELLWKQHLDGKPSTSARLTNPGAAAPGGQTVTYATRGEQEWAKFKAENGLVQAPTVERTRTVTDYKNAGKHAAAAAEAAEKEYNDFLNSEEYAAMLDRRGIAQLQGSEIFSLLTGYSRQEEDRLKLKEKELRQKAEQLRSEADRYKEYDIWENAESLAAQAEAELEDYLHTEEYAAWQIARDKRQAERERLAQISGNPVVFPSAWDRNDKETELRANAEYYRQIATSKQEQAMMDKDLQEMQTWTKAEQDALKVYALGAYQNTMGRPEAAEAFAMANSPEGLFRKYGEQRVKEIAESYMRSQSQEAKQMVQTAAQGGAGKSILAGTGHSLASVGANLAGSLTGPLGYLAEAAGRTGRYSTLDPNNPGQLMGTYAGAVRQEVAGNIQDTGFGKAGATVYQAGMSALDNLARMVAGRGAGSLALAATGSFGQAVSQYSAQGATPMEAVALGIINGSLEVLTEKISLDNILDEMAEPKTGIQMIKAALRAGGIEVSEEELSFLGSTLAEAAVLREKSGYNQQIAMLKAFGLSDAAARAQANRGVIDEAWQTAVQSFLSGGMMSGATSLYGKAVSKVQEKQLQGTVKEAQQQILNREKTGQGTVAIREGTAVADDVRAQAERIAGVTGRQIEFYTSDAGEDGFFQDGKIYVNTRGVEPMAQIISHELTHSVEMSEAYKEISTLVLNRIRQEGGNLEQLRQEKRAQYAANGVQLKTGADVDSEIVASYVAKHLLTNEQEIVTLTRENPSLAQKVRDWLDGLLAKLGNGKAQERTFVKKARDAYARALEQTGGNVSGSEQAQQTSADVDLMALKEEMYGKLRSGEWTEADFEAALDEYEQMVQRAGVDPMAMEDKRFGVQADPHGQTKYSISEIRGQDTSYGTGVVLDTEIFDGVAPRNWGKTLSDYVYKNLAGAELTVYDENGNPETIHLAKASDRVRKDGAKNSHKVLGKLAGHRGDAVRAQAIVQLSEVLETSRYEKSTDEHSHQWMDENGWIFRKVYLQSKDGGIYEATLNIADGRDRKILYEINRVHLIDEKETSASIPSTDSRQRPRYQEPGMGGTQSEVYNEASQVPDGNAPSRDVRNELASTPTDIVSDGSVGVNRKYSFREKADPFYSHMARVIDDVKQEKLGAASVVSMLRGRGVKAEEIKWSGIEMWLDGKKSVTKSELQEFMEGSMLNIEETVKTGGSEITIEPAAYYFDGESNDVNVMRGGEVIDYLSWDDWNECYESDATGYSFDNEDEILRYYSNKYGSGGTRWGRYSLSGGGNYREMLFRMPGSDYSNDAMDMHWPDEQGILAHARVQDFETQEGKMLFIEEIQSDWHNAGAKNGYSDKGEVQTVEKIKQECDDLYIKIEDMSTELTGLAGEWEVVAETKQGAELIHRYDETVDRLNAMSENPVAPDAPFRNNYHEYVLKRLIREAAENGYDSIGWTPAEIQSERWSPDYAEGYRIEYDQDIPKFLNKYGKKWGVRVGKTMLDTDQGRVQVWTIPVTAEMKRAVLHEGQPLYSFSDKKQERNEVKVNREELPTKARKYLESAERGLLNHIGKALGVPYHAKRETLQPMIQALSDEYLGTGTISQESMDKLFEEAYQAGVVIDREFYDKYKGVKDHLRTTAVTISERDQADIADFQDFRRRSFGTLRITKEGGIPVDSYYRELQEMAPELFPDHISHPADQLQRMLEVGQSIRVSESSLDSYYGRYAQEYKVWQKNDFIAAIHDDLAELRKVQRYAQERMTEEEKDEEITLEQAEESWAQLKAARRNYEKVNAKNLLSTHDELQVGRLLRGEVLLEHLEGEENFKGIKAVYEAKLEHDKIGKVIGRYKRQVRKKRLDRADELLQTANEWKDKKTGIQYSRETMRRNILDIVPDQAVAMEVLKEYFEPVQHAEAQSTKFKNEYRDRVRALDLNTKVTEGNEVSEAYAVQLLGEAMDNIRVLENARGRMRTRDGRTLTEWRALVQDMWEHSPNLDKAKIEGSVQEFRKIYDELFQKMNRARLENGYEPVNYRQGYFPHFQPGSDGDGIIAYFGKVLGIDTSVEALPTTINGLTHTFKPGIQWFGNAQERLGFKTAYDAVEGFDKYIEGCSSVIHHTENIQKLRALGTQARYRTSDVGLKEQVDAVQRDTRLTDEERQMKIREIYEKGKFTLSNFVVELDEYTNLLANKKSRFDRTMEGFLGRKAYTIMKNVESRVAANMIAGNISSAVTNFIPLTQAMGRIGSTELLRGMKDARKAIVGGTSDIVGMSDFLTNRRGSDVLVKGWADKLSGKLGMPMELIDNFTSEAIVRAAYYQNLKRGMTESEAIHQADILAASIMADRSKGAMPTLFESTNPLFKALTQFQLEVNNQYSEIFKDMPREYAEQAKWVLALAFMKYFIGAFLFNELEEKVKGRRSALDPIGIAADFAEDWKANGIGDAGANLTVNLLEGMPFSSALNVLGFDLDGGRVPVASAIPDVPALWEALTGKNVSKAERWDTVIDELQKPLIYLAMPVGGNQLSKTWKGIAAYLKGGSYGLNQDGEEILQYPVYKDEGGDAFWNLVKSMVFGKSSLGTAQDWVKDGFDSLNAKQTAVYQDMIEAGAKDREAYELIDAVRRTAKPDTEYGSKVLRENRIKLIRESGLSDDCKDIVYYGMIAGDSERELMDALTDAGAEGGISEFVAAYTDASRLEGDAKRTGLRDVFRNSALTEEEKQVAIRDLLGPEEVNEKGNLTKYGKYVYATEQGMSTDDYMELYARNISLDDYQDLVDVGLSGKGAMDLAVKLGELDTTGMKSTEKWNVECDAIMAAGLSEEDQMAALVSVSYESTGRMIRVSYDHGIEPSVFIDFRRALPDFDANSSGSYSQNEVEAAIDAVAGNEIWLALTGGKVALTNEQKAVLWQLHSSSWKPSKNPYDKEIGQQVYDAVQRMKEEKN